MKKVSSKKTAAPKKKAPAKKPAAKRSVVKVAPTIAPKTPVHQWVHDGEEVLVLRFADANGKSYEGFQHPMEIGHRVTPPDWDPKPKCGGGIHGWAWGIGLGEGKDPDWSALWQVYGAKPEDVVGNLEAGMKCKFRTGVLRHKGDWHSAMMFILDGQKRWVEHFSDGQSSATGDRSASSATGDRSASSATGYRSASSATGYSSASSATGDSSASSATGYSSASSATGDSSASSATGDSSASSATGDRSASVVTGLDGKARAGKYGCIALAWWNKKAKRSEMRAAEIGCGDGSDGKLKADTWYQVNAKGEFEEAA
jgi:hypothetical protein